MLPVLFAPGLGGSQLYAQDLDSTLGISDEHTRLIGKASFQSSAEEQVSWDRESLSMKNKKKKEEEKTDKEKFDLLAARINQRKLLATTRAARLKKAPQTSELTVPAKQRKLAASAGRSRALENVEDEGNALFTLPGEETEAGGKDGLFQSDALFTLTQTDVENMLAAGTRFLHYGMGVSEDFRKSLPSGFVGLRSPSELNEFLPLDFIKEQFGSDLYCIWVNLWEMFKFKDDFYKKMRLVVDPETGRTDDDASVRISVENFGDTQSVEYVDPNSTAEWVLGKYLAYFYHLAQVLRARGYSKKTLKAAPYDFRRAPDEMEDYYKQLQKLIEDTSRENNGKKVVLIAHSMGNLVLLYFLVHKVDQAWKEQYVHSLVALAAPWAGSVKSLKVLCAGTDLINAPCFHLDPLQVRKVFRSWPSSFFLLPSPQVWGPHALVESPDGRYTADPADLDRLFKDFKDPEDSAGRKMRKLREVTTLFPDLSAAWPGVPLHCLYGVDVDTPGSLVYNNPDDFPDKPQILLDKGDGTVNLRSLEAYAVWKAEHADAISVLRRPRVDHMAILKDQEVFGYILREVLQVL